MGETVMMDVYNFFYRRAMFLPGNIITLLLRSINYLARQPSFRKAQHHSGVISEMVQDLRNIWRDHPRITRLYGIRKYFITTMNDQVTDNDFFLTEIWKDSLFSANSNLQVFYSTKMRYYLVNLMITEPLLNNYEN